MPVDHAVQHAVLGGAGLIPDKAMGHADDVRAISGLRQCRESDTHRVRGRAYDGGRPDGCLFLGTSPVCRSVQINLQLSVVISDLTGVIRRASRVRLHLGHRALRFRRFHAAESASVPRVRKCGGSTRSAPRWGCRRISPLLWMYCAETASEAASEAEEGWEYFHNQLLAAEHHHFEWNNPGYDGIPGYEEYLKRRTACSTAGCRAPRRRRVSGCSRRRCFPLFRRCRRRSIQRRWVRSRLRASSPPPPGHSDPATRSAPDPCARRARATR